MPDHRQARALAEDGRVYTVAGDKLPGARGFGEPVRLLIDIDAEVRDRRS